MRKTVLIIAVAMVLSVPILNATSRTSTSIHTFEVITSSEISAFCMAIVKGDIETVEKLLELGANVNEVSLGLTPAMYAAKYNKVDILKLLVKKGADLNRRSDRGFTAKRFAQLSNAKEALKFIEGLQS